MAKNTMADLDPTAANNTDALGQAITGASNANTIETMIQSVLGLLARFYGDLGGTGTVGGTADAITLTTGSTYQALESGIIVSFKAGSANTGAATLNVDSLGAKKIRHRGDTALEAGAMAANGRYMLIYDTAYDSAAGAWILMNPTADAYAPGHLYGLTLSINATDPTNDIDIAVGSARDSTDVTNIVLASALVKRLDAAWAVGTNQGMLDGTESVAGTPDVSTWYHIWLIKRPDTGVVDVLASESATAPTMPTNYTLKRWIGAVYNDSSGNILAFDQVGDDFLFDTPAVAYAPNTFAGTTAVSLTLRTPLGVKTMALLQCRFVGGAGLVGATCVITSLDQADVASAAAGAHDAINPVVGIGASFPKEVITNTSSQIRARTDTATTDLYVTTRGWRRLRHA